MQCSMLKYEKHLGFVKTFGGRRPIGIHYTVVSLSCPDCVPSALHPMLPNPHVIGETKSCFRSTSGAHPKPYTLNPNPWQAFRLRCGPAGCRCPGHELAGIPAQTHWVGLMRDFLDNCRDSLGPSTKTIILHIFLGFR